SATPNLIVVAVTPGANVFSTGALTLGAVVVAEVVFVPLPHALNATAPSTTPTTATLQPPCRPHRTRRSDVAMTRSPRHTKTDPTLDPNEAHIASPTVTAGLVIRPACETPHR